MLEPLAVDAWRSLMLFHVFTHLALAVHGYDVKNSDPKHNFSRERPKATLVSSK